jgi:hypothetical protein
MSHKFALQLRVRKVSHCSEAFALQPSGAVLKGEPQVQLFFSPVVGCRLPIAKIVSQTQRTSKGLSYYHTDRPFGLLGEGISMPNQSLLLALDCLEFCPVLTMSSFVP